MLEEGFIHHVLFSMLQRIVAQHLVRPYTVLYQTDMISHMSHRICSFTESKEF